MNFVVGNLTEPVFRPPSEWDALLVAVTNGCTHRCTFCSMYRTKKFEIRKELDQAQQMYGNRVRKIFFEDGNAFTVKSDILIEVTQQCYKVHPNLKKVSAYAHVKDIVKKSPYHQLSFPVIRFRFCKLVFPNRHKRWFRREIPYI